MIPFLRRLRQGLLTNNRFSKYFFYAIGEIILVVIGILIALKINNWNEAQKDREREKMYLQSLKFDLKESQAELNRVIKKTDTIALSTIELLKPTFDTVPMPSPATFDSLINNTYGYTIAMTNEGTINDITGSGDLKVIRNDSLRRMIASWEAGFKMIREREDLLKRAFQKNAERLQNKVDLFNPEGAVKNESVRRFIINDLEHRNGLFELVISSTSLNNLYREKIESLDTMIWLTEREMRELE